MIDFSSKPQLTVGNQYGFLMAPIHLAGFDRTCKKHKQSSGNSFAQLKRYAKKDK